LSLREELMNLKKNFVSVSATRFALFSALVRVVRNGSACMGFGWSPCQLHPVSASKLFVHIFVLAAIAVGLAACNSSKRSVDYYDKQATDPYVIKVCEPDENNFYYSRIPGPAVLHAVGVAPDKLADGWTVSTLEKEGIDPEVIDELLQAAENGEFPNVDSILIARNGKLVLEAYFNGFDREKKHRIYSATKSFASALVGIAIDKGLITDINQPVSSYFPDYWPEIENGGALKNSLTLAHLLTMTAGVDLKPVWKNDDQRNNVIKYSSDWVKTKLDFPITRQPGTQFDYDSSNTFLIGQIVARVAEEPLLAFSKKHLFDPLGISHYCNLENLNGQAIPNNGLILRSRDMLKFGQLYLDDGVWNGRRIISEQWVADSTRRHISTAAISQKKDGPQGYGYQWWTGKKNDDGQHYYYAVGHGSQIIMILPFWNMVVVFTSNEWADLVLNDEHITKILEDHIPRAVLKRRKAAGVSG